MIFETVKFSDITVNHDKKRIPLSTMKRSKRQGSYRYYGAQGVIDYIDDYIFDGKYLLIAEDGENLKSKKQNIAQLAEGRFWVNNHAHIVQCNERCRLEYLCFMLNSMDLSGYITGSAQPKLSQANMNSISFGIPSVEMQDLILSVILPIEKRIATNTAINENLEQQAQAIYAQMFIESAEESWETGSLSDIAVITMGQSPKGDTFNETGEGAVFYQGRTDFGFRFPTRRLYTTEPKRIALCGDALMSVRAPVGDLNVAYEECCIGRGLAAIHSKDNHQSFVLYTLFTLKKQLDVFNGEGTVFGSINKESLNSMEITIPPRELMDRFESTVSPIDRAIRNNYEEICRLQAIRDTLLPKLMNGEIDVSAVKI